MSLNYEACAPYLRGKGRNVYSQFGEDGLIEATLEKIGPVTKWCFEFGAADGTYFSNTKRLWEDGWNAVLIESDADQYEKLAECASETVRTVHAEVLPSNINELLSAVPWDCGVGSIDVDGQDYWLFEALDLRPRVLLVEHCPYRKGWHIPAVGASGAKYNQATLNPLVRLGEEKGYQLIATTFCNAVFLYVGHTRTAA